MRWDRLICDTRFGLENYEPEQRPDNGMRSVFRRDYDRLVFSSPFRRLQNKTQVFPLPGSIFVHNRLTHSLEVSTVGRSMAGDVAQLLQHRHADEQWVHCLDSAADIVAASCLAHDLGNPPFGHSGERAISTYFSEGAGSALRDKLTAEQWSDLTNFDGNANAFRLLTHQFNGRRPGGFGMTYSTLAGIVKYPYSSSLAKGRNKFGFFTTEAESYRRIAEAMGIIRLDSPAGTLRYVRHPLVYLVEAADDICYQIMDIEDAHKLGILQHEEVYDLLLGYFSPERRDRMMHNMRLVDDPNERISYIRSSVIGVLTRHCADVFVAHERELLDGTFSGSLLNHIPDRERDSYRRCSELSRDKIYRAKDVVDIEIAGTHIITYLTDTLIKAVLNPELSYSQLLLSQVPKQYCVHDNDVYGRIQAALDHVTGMTDIYALDMYRRLNGMSLKINN